MPKRSTVPPAHTAGAGSCRFTARAFGLASLALLSATVAPRPGLAAERPFRVEVLRDGWVLPASLSFAADGSLWVLERGNSIDDVQTPPRLYRLDLPSGESTEIGGTPQTHLHVNRWGRNGGALGLELDPDFAENHRLYLCYHHVSQAGDRPRYENRLSSFRLQGERLVEERVLVDAVPGNRNHNGCRIQVGPDGKIYYSTGEGPIRRNSRRLDNPAGKILRVNIDGSIPDDNPFPDSPIWSYGHRNPQGLGFHPSTGELWATEHGPSVNDEINRIEKGRFYGWPDCQGTARPGDVYEKAPGESDTCGIASFPILAGRYLPAVRSYTPTIGISDLAFYQGEAFPDWQGDMLVVSLKGGQLIRLATDGARVSEEEELLTGTGEEDYGRLRDVAVGPDGWVYLLSDVRSPQTTITTGTLFRLRPASDS